MSDRPERRVRRDPDVPSRARTLLSQVDLVFYNGASVDTGTLELANVSNGANQRTLLAATPAMEDACPRSQADVEYGGAAINPAGGGLCLASSPDSARSTASPGAPPSVTGRRARPETAIPDGTSLVRDISAGCNTLLERERRHRLEPRRLRHPAASPRHSRIQRRDSTRAVPTRRSRRSRRPRPRIARRSSSSRAATDSDATSTDRRLRGVRLASSSRASCQGASTRSQCARPRRTARSTARPRRTPGRSSRRGSRLAARPGLEDPAQVVRTVGRVELDRTAQATQCGAAN